MSLPPPPWGGDAARPLNTVRDVLRSFLPLVHETAAAAELVIERFSPRVLVVGNDITLEGRIAAAKARRVGLPTVCLMHGSLAGNPLQRHHCADRLLVYGPGPRDLLVALGIAAERVIVCGAPYLDGMPRPSDQPHPAIRRAFGVGPGTPWALVATSGPGDSVSASHHRAVVEAVTRLSVQMPDVSFIAKLHRKDRPEIYERARRTIAGSRLHVVPHGRGGFPAGIFDWLQGSSVVLTGASTVALEAMLMDIPVVTIDLADEFRDVDFIDAGATVHIRHQEDLVPAVRALVTKPDLARDARERGRAFVARYFGAVDGGASRRGAAAVVAAMDLAGRRLRCVVDD